MEYGTFVNLIKNNYVPVILVVSSNEVDIICKKNNNEGTLLLPKLLSKYSFASQSTKIQTLGDQPYEIRGFQVRLSSPTDLDVKCNYNTNNTISSNDTNTTTTTNNNNQYLQHVATYHASEKLYSEVALHGKADLSYFVKSLQGRDATPWYNFYRWEYIRSMPLVDFEFFEHPVACTFIFCFNFNQVNRYYSY